MIPPPITSAGIRMPVHAKEYITRPIEINVYSLIVFKTAVFEKSAFILHRYFGFPPRNPSDGDPINKDRQDFSICQQFFALAARPEQLPEEFAATTGFTRKQSRKNAIFVEKHPSLEKRPDKSPATADRYADVILPLAAPAMTFAVPDAMLRQIVPGCRVIVQLGARTPWPPKVLGLQA